MAFLDFGAKQIGNGIQHADSPTECNETARTSVLAVKRAFPGLKAPLHIGRNANSRHVGNDRHCNMTANVICTLRFEWIAHVDSSQLLAS